MTSKTQDDDKEVPVAGVIGWPIGHSRSPLIHNFWLRKSGLKGSYVPIAIPPEALEEEVNRLKQQGFSGFNVTIPHKEAIFALVDEKDEAATAIGAVNTVALKSDGTLRGLNTDGLGFIENISSTKTNWKTGTACVIGAGGAARAIVYGLAKAGAPRIEVFNRTEERAQNLVADFQDLGTEVVALPMKTLSERMKDASLLVNTTSLGMTGEPPLDLDLTALSQDALVTDIVYVPLETALLKSARERGNEVVDGLGMLIHQARFAFKAWFDVMPEASREVRDLLVVDLEKSK